MATKNINSSPFDDSTQLKLQIFRDCFKEWFPVFIHSKYISQITIFDFFAGSGSDSIGNYGSPLILLEEARGLNRRFCGTKRKSITFSFNEKLKEKYLALETNVNNHLSKCESENQCEGCIYDVRIHQKDFKSLFSDKSTIQIFEDHQIGKFVLLDQYGFKEIDDNTFDTLISYPSTDFIFFISSSFVKRFQDHPSVKSYINTENINFDNAKPNECHRLIADYFRRRGPSGKNYYLHHFTIQKEKGKGNYYGLIFGTNHSYGMEKFLKVCWNKDPRSGEANFNINNDFEPGTLFYDDSNTNKKVRFEKELKDKILNGEITENIRGMKYTLTNGCLPKLFTETVLELEKKGLIRRFGDVNNDSSKIHSVKKYFIQRIK